MRVIDDVMPEVMQDQVHSICTHKDFNWSFQPDTTYDYSREPVIAAMGRPMLPAFSHMAFMEYKPRTDVCDMLSSSLLCMSDKAGQDTNILYRVRFGMYLPLANAPLHNSIHVDVKVPHTVALYYVNDADGDTFFFNQNREIVKRVSPKKGRMVVFDGLTLHASSMPTKNYRISLNLGYVPVPKNYNQNSN